MQPDQIIQVAGIIALSIGACYLAYQIFKNIVKVALVVAVVAVCYGVYNHHSTGQVLPDFANDHKDQVTDRVTKDVKKQVTKQVTQTITKIIK
jgi:uncharacterized membrane protein YebE (DUF533 family)